MTLSTGDVLGPDVVGRRAPGSYGDVRRPWRGVLDRLRRDRVATAGAVVVLLVVLAALLAPVICRLLGIDPYSGNPDLVDPDTGLPLGGFGGMSLDHPLGVEPGSGRDVLARILHGARTSLLVAGLATLLTVVLGVGLGMLAGFRGRWVDSLIGRAMDLTLAFPLLLFAIGLLVTLQTVDSLFGLSGQPLRVAVLVVVLGCFSWAYLGRVVRGQTLSLRDREFVDAARSLGASDTRILFRELLPNLSSTILVYATLTLPVNVLNEAALSFLGLGVLPPTASWGEMIASATSWFEVVPTAMIFPALAVLVTVLALNLLGDGLRDALDPRSAR